MPGRITGSGFSDDDEAVQGRERTFGYWPSIGDYWSLSPLLVRFDQSPRACAPLVAPVVVVTGGSAARYDPAKNRGRHRFLKTGGK